MKNLQKIIVKYLTALTLILVIVILIVTITIQCLNAQQQARAGSATFFLQIEHILNENSNELSVTEEEYRQTCIRNAEGIAYIIQHHPQALDDINELKKIAAFSKVDEIHIFNKEGEIVMGTHPEYFGYTFDSGEQIGFFKPMLTDKSLKLCQDITPNTAESKLMQYSAVWSENEEFILQVGMAPQNIVKVMEKNELSYIFSMLRVNPGIGFLAIDKNTGTIIGTTDNTTLNQNINEIGISLNDIESKKDGFHATVNNVNAYCTFKEIDGNYIGRIIPISTIYASIPRTTIGLFICLILIATIIVVAVSRYINKYVIQNIHNTNASLKNIADGNLDEIIDIQSSIEFSELSSHINEMVKSLLASTYKMSYILDKTDIQVGVYEYNKHMQKVRYTSYISKLMCFDSENYTADYTLFKSKMDTITSNPVNGENSIYLIDRSDRNTHNIYVKIEETTKNNDILGIVMDVTQTINKQKQIEAERDFDILTGLYNRRGLEIKLNELFKEPAKLRLGAFIMIDADDLKGINDQYGHEKGDIYLNGIADLIKPNIDGTAIAARQGGDEFIIFMYGYDNEETILDKISFFQNMQDMHTVQLTADLIVPVRFSLGYCITDNNTRYDELLKEADEKMYADKAARKSNLK